MMLRTRIGHGCLQLVAVACAVGVVEADEVVAVRSSVLDIEYSVNPEALPLDSVQLWYTLDGGSSWVDGGIDQDRQSPISFQAPQEGLYGFLIVARNATGPSGGPPLPRAKPHLWAFVDYTPPVAQMHPLRQTSMLGQRVLQVRWTAIDSHFTPRPVEISYQRLPDNAWYPMTPDPVANTGRFDWRLPDGLVGPVSVRVSATDQGGHRATTESQLIELALRGLEAGKISRALAASGSVAGQVGEPTAFPGSPRAKKRATRIFDEALALKDSGEFREGVARMRRVVRLDPQRASAFAQMGEMLYRLGDFDRSLEAYELALGQQPAMRMALRGAARVHRRGNDLAAAARSLRTILRHNPNDAEVWVNLGDIAIYQGDDILARECYTRATRIDPDATQVIEDARKRLDLMAEVSRTYQRQGGR